MCGIAGIITKERIIEKLYAIIDVIVYRGPDGYGVWSCENADIGIGHRRLSIVDFSSAGKQIHQQIITNYLPNFFECPKNAFSMPLAHWLCGELRDSVGDLLNEPAIRERDYLDPQSIKRLWAEYLSGKYDRQSHLWNVLLFQGWLRQKQNFGHNISPNDK